MRAVKFLFAILLIVLTCGACASLRKHDVESSLIAEMGQDCKKVEIKMDHDQGVYVITYTGKVSKDRCPIALIRGWKDGGIIEEKEVEICDCKDR